jgi:hypothetical protein
MWAESRRQMGLSPFAAPTEMRIPMGLLGQWRNQTGRLTY